MKFSAGKKDIRKFFIVFGVILTLFAGRHFLKGDIKDSIALFSIALIVSSCGFLFPNVLKPVYILFRRIGYGLGWVNGRVLLGLIYLVVITPVGLIMKLFQKDFLNKCIKKQISTYWENKLVEESNKAYYERQF